MLSAAAFGAPALLAALSGCGADPAPGTAPPSTGGADRTGAGGSTAGVGGIGTGLAATQIGSVGPRTPTSAAGLARGRDVLSAFAGDLFGRLAGTPGNLACSPYSVALALAMTREGARGATATEMDAVLRSTSAADLDAALNAVAQLLATRPGRRKTASGEDGVVALEVACRLFGQQGVHWEQPFLDALAAGYGADLALVDYVHAAEPARQRINLWTAEHTAGLIKDLLPPGSLRDDTRLVLVNALHLKAPWRSPFEKALTAPAPFHLADGTVATVPTMSDGDVATAWGEGDGWSGARLPYAGEQLAMTVLLPDRGREQALVSLLAGGLTPVLEAFRPASVQLSMPRFSMVWGTTSLKKVLQEMGMRAAFTDRADFSGMTRDTGLLVDDVHHQATITVDEAGTEAAAATAVVVRRVIAAADPRRLVLDRPFLYVVHDVESGAPLVVGRVGDPR